MTQAIPLTRLMLVFMGKKPPRSCIAPSLLSLTYRAKQSGHAGCHTEEEKLYVAKFYLSYYPFQAITGLIVRFEISLPTHGLSLWQATIHKLRQQEGCGREGKGPLGTSLQCDIA